VEESEEEGEDDDNDGDNEEEEEESQGDDDYTLISILPFWCLDAKGGEILDLAL